MSQDGKGQSLLLQSVKIRNAAAPGSLLKVWEGTLDVGGGSSLSKNGGDNHASSSASAKNNGHVEC